ncbi:hypothetical protein H7J88_03280 [Mycolicibacterium flavescens]|uniref:hypothetical protein n=1 Tax=Mycolicibacterium flavescens TaxID=1776 RepID=UPI0010423A6D|nr:hypothetical protein [Mycolicibacterium flavescens]MCV7278667.1 hypothetical protein [Mycolicibacterium flavescens]
MTGGALLGNGSATTPARTGSIPDIEQWPSVGNRIEMTLYHAEPVTFWKRSGAPWCVVEDRLLILTRPSKHGLSAGAKARGRNVLQRE